MNLNVWLLRMVAIGIVMISTFGKSYCQDADNVYYAYKQYDPKEFSVNEELQGELIEGEYVAQKTPVIDYVKSNPWIIYTLVVFVFGLAIRAGIIDWQCWVWNRKLNKYVKYKVYENCLSDGEEWKLRCMCLHSDYRLWMQVGKWHYSQFIADKKLMEEIEKFEMELCNHT